MKKNIIALAVAAAISTPMVAQADPVVYGHLKLNLKNMTDKGTKINSTASRIGVKGSNKLGNGLKAVYKLEFGLPQLTDKNGKDPLMARNQYLGLAGSFGVVLMGRHDTPMKMSQPSDILNDGAADLKRMAFGMGMSGAGGEVRAGEVIAYVSPSFSGTKIVVAGVSADTDADQSPLNVISVAVMHGSKKKGLYLAGAYNAWSKDATGGDAATEMRLSAQYKAAGLVTSAMYQTFDKTTGKDGNNLQLQLGYKMGKIMPKIKYSTASYDGADTGTGIGVGVAYFLAKKTKLYMNYINQDDAMAGKGDSSTGKANTIIAAGLVHKF